MMLRFLSYLVWCVFNICIKFFVLILIEVIQEQSRKIHFGLNKQKDYLSLKNIALSANK